MGQRIAGDKDLDGTNFLPRSAVVLRDGSIGGRRLGRDGADVVKQAGLILF
jgi:hypothetical protein